MYSRTRNKRIVREPLLNLKCERSLKFIPLTQIDFVEVCYLVGAHCRKRKINQSHPMGWKKFKELTSGEVVFVLLCSNTGTCPRAQRDIQSSKRNNWSECIVCHKVGKLLNEESLVHLYVTYKRFSHLGVQSTLIYNRYFFFSNLLSSN